MNWGLYLKKFLILSLALCLGIILGACGSKDTAKKMIPKRIISKRK